VGAVVGTVVGIAVGAVIGAEAPADGAPLVAPPLSELVDEATSLALPDGALVEFPAFVAAGSS
jgi:hypothetical protein